MEKHSIETLRVRAASATPTLLNKVGFEDRSIATVTECPDYAWNKILTLVSTDRSEKAQHNLAVLEDTLRDRGMSYDLIGELNQSDPLKTETAIASALDDVLDNWGDEELWIDFTALRREELLILLRLIFDRCDDTSIKRLFGVYSAARQMGDWLSGDVVEIRSVVGYPGEISPARSTTLIVLMGFEINRARAIIEAYEPSRIIIGVPGLESSINEDLFLRNKEIIKRVSEDYNPLIVKHFNFSANNPVQAFLDLTRIIADFESDNIVIAPLHTKISTLATGAVAISNPKIQICYAAVDEYNEDTYSRSSGDFYLLPLADLKLTLADGADKF